MSYTFKKYKSSSEIPGDWNHVIGQHNIMLSKEYLEALETSGPENMKCFYVGFFLAGELIGGALFQYLNFIRHKTFQRDHAFYGMKNFVAKKFSKNVMILGNNMLTGQNGFYFDASKITADQVIPLLDEAVQEMQKQEGKTSLIIYKDYQSGFISHFQGKNHQSFFRFSVQPNMILKLQGNWLTFDDYLSAFLTKYRTRAKSAKKKSDGISKAEMHPDEIEKHQKEMNLLYQNVAENAPFNTFFLTENHFKSMKESLKRNFRVFGYYLDEKLIGFYTLILNNQDIDTYFLGYDKDLQKEKQIYLNMLLDMVEFGIHEKFNRIIFGRTALEIKSTVGAQPVEIFGLIRHHNPFINRFMGRIFTSLNPKTEWVQRKPFK
ncbi:peptidogalycan biosysnthesis protein [Chryseobacterium gregarium]|uniref:peptidogalycan biosysnthesis protein n=1 Tax=Chryseobacterium gregarium TaxID=456299 RepID=UPI000420F555|nr:peptidogalycan biosysnthesis protein [Chryseobacterium gregarium]